MKRITHFSDETVKRAQELLGSDTEMLHEFPPNWRRCAHCNKYQVDVDRDEECPALLRCALDMVKAESGKIAEGADHDPVRDYDLS